MVFLISLFLRLWASPSVALLMAAMMWGGHTIVARASVGEVSPMLMMALRWLLCLAILLFFYGRDLKQQWSSISQNISWMALMGGVFLAGFTIFFILGAQYTSATNLGIMQSSIPGIVVFLGFLFLRQKFRFFQICGLSLSMTGVVYLICKGSLLSLMTMAFNLGDLLMLVACICYAGFTVGLTKKMPVNTFLLLTVFSFFAAITLAIGTIFEYLDGDLVLPSPFGFFAIFYSGVMASLVGQLLFVRGVRAIGSNRAGLYLNMVPVFGAMMAVIFLGENLQLFHFISALFVLSGIYLVERFKLN